MRIVRKVVPSDLPEIEKIEKQRNEGVDLDALFSFLEQEGAGYVVISNRKVAAYLLFSSLGEIVFIEGPFTLVKEMLSFVFRDSKIKKLTWVFPHSEDQTNLVESLGFTLYTTKKTEVEVLEVWERFNLED
jgi:hypothetical protein